MIEANSAFGLDILIDEVKNYDCRRRHFSNSVAGGILRCLEYLKFKSEEPPLGEPPDYIPLSFHQLVDMIGEPVYIKNIGCIGKWEIVRALEKDCDGEYIRFKGEVDYRMVIDHNIYRSKEGAEQ